MTFYSVISAILFMGACRQIIVGLNSNDTAQLLMAAVFAIFVFNDAIFTSDVTEGDNKMKIEYTLPLKIIDLVNFLILVFSMIIINPSNNLFQVNTTHMLPFLQERYFWALLGCYWLLIMLWTYLAGVYNDRHYPKLNIYSSFLLICVLFVVSIVSVTCPSALGVFRWIGALYPFAHILFLRPLFFYLQAKKLIK